MANQQLTIFISYSRADSEFVDRLDSDLRARGFRTWVDRNRLEGGVDWEREITAAIAACDLFLIVLSPPAVASPSVREEFEKATRLSKQMMPVVYQNFSTPSWLAVADRIQRQDFTNTNAYALNLKRLLYAIQDPTLNLSVGNDQLYNLALSMRAADPERAAIILQHIIDRAPTYFGGQVQRDLADLDAQLYVTRVTRLRAQAEQARREGQYGVEAASLEALLALGDRDVGAAAWAHEFLPIAQQNREMLGPYGVIQQRILDGDKETARRMLQLLWSKAPYFRDPSNVAPALGLTVPPTYEQVTAETAERERKDKAIAAERERFIHACKVLQANLANSDIADVRDALRRWNYDLADSPVSTLISRLVESWDQNERSLAAASRLESLQTERESRRSALIVAGVFFAAIGIVIVLAANPHNPAGGFFGLACTVGVAIWLWYLALTMNRRSLARITAAKNQAVTARSQADAIYQHWRQIAEQVLQQRIDAINRG